MQVTPSYTFKIGDLISFQGREILDREPARPSTYGSFPPRQPSERTDGTSRIQIYRVTGVILGGENAIPGYRYTTRTQLGPVPPLGVKMLTVKPLSDRGEYTDPQWFVNVTHMCLSQFVDAEPLWYVDKLYYLGDVESLKERILQRISKGDSTKSVSGVDGTKSVSGV